MDEMSRCSRRARGRSLKSYNGQMSSKDLSIHIGHEELVIRGRYETASIINGVC